MQEAQIEKTPEGQVPVDGGWFILNLGELAWETVPGFGIWRGFDAPDADPSQPGVGVHVHVLQPGEAPRLLPREEAQEGFIVLSGECIAIVEGQERRMRQWDYLHSPPGTQHITVGAGRPVLARLLAGSIVITWPALLLADELPSDGSLNGKADDFCVRVRRGVAGGSAGARARRPAPVASGKGWWRRRQGESDGARADWIPTSERFLDPTTDRLMRVWLDPQTRTRHYVAEPGERRGKQRDDERSEARLAVREPEPDPEDELSYGVRPREVGSPISCSPVRSPSACRDAVRKPSDLDESCVTTPSAPR